MKTPPYLMDDSGYCYQFTFELARDASLRPWCGGVSPAGFVVEGTAPPPPWQGETVVCIASGPSLTLEDCDLVRRAGVRTMVANDSWRRAPFADVLYAVDAAWWEQHVHELAAAPAQRWTAAVSAAEEFGLHLHLARSSALNSGARMIELASELGAARVLLLGFDCSIAAGTHWHGNHTRTDNPDARAVSEWHRHFADVALAVDGKTMVVNCSRRTALTCFPCGDLAHELAVEKCRKSSKTVVE